MPRARKLFRFARESFQRWRSLAPADLYPTISALTSAALDPAWRQTEHRFAQHKQINYLSMEWLPGPYLDTALEATGLCSPLRGLLGPRLFEETLRYARDLGLGNGGLGRLAACFIDAAANQHVPMTGYGLRFKHGFFRQDLVEGRQIDRDDPWLLTNSPALTRHRTISDARGQPITVKLGGTVNPVHRPQSANYPHGFVDHQWQHAITVKLSRHDLPIPSADGTTVLTLGLWDVNSHNAGAHPLAPLIDRINHRLYPDDSTPDGKQLRLLQEHILASATIQDIIARHERRFGHGHLDNLPDTAAIQLNDTHPALAIPKLIRILHDDRSISWPQALAITRQVCFYTNHTLAPEALETWRGGIMRELLPRHYGIIQGLHRDLMREVSARRAVQSRRHQTPMHNATAIVQTADNDSDETIHMARLAAAYTKMTNGVSQLHSRLVRETLFPDLALLDRHIWNVTDGITPRRWLQQANPGLATLITTTTGPDWLTNLRPIDTAFAGRDTDPRLLEEITSIKAANKKPLAALIKHETGLSIPDNALIDSHIKRFHAYKRQFLNLVHTVALYQDILADPGKDRPNIVKLFAGKAAPSYDFANDCIGLVNHLAALINQDPRIDDKLKLVFVGDYGVSKAQTIIPASDISQQISVAGMEASGTSNMKFSLNGALTVGTRDGANIEIGARAGEANFFFFGIDEKRVAELRQLPHHEYRARFVDGDDNARLRNALGFMRDHLGANPATSRYAYMAETILRGDDHWMVAADFNSYWSVQDKAHRLYRNEPHSWARQALLNIRAGAGFSADDAILTYAEKWNVQSRNRSPAPPQSPARPRLLAAAPPTPAAALVNS